MKIENEKPSGKLLNSTKKLFGNSNFYYTGKTFQRAD